MIRTIYFEAENVYILNQNRLPARVEFEKITNHLEIAEAIRTLKVRGAPLIGVTAAFGLALAVCKYSGERENLRGHYDEAEQLLAATRPTAVNLFWAIARMREIFEQNLHENSEVLGQKMLQEAQAMCAEDIAINQQMGELGQVVFAPESRVLTICNAGGLATCGYGTALGVIRSAHQRHNISQVWACETRPVLQGARLTVWELMQDHIPVTLITDSMAGCVMKNQSVDAVIVGADRVAANGDTANKIGTYGLAVLAHYHNIPFYVAAPLSSIDMNILSGEEIPIEERNAEEVRYLGGQCITVPEVRVFNPAFDVTPAGLISAIITEAGIIMPPLHEGLQEVFRKRG